MGDGVDVEVLLEAASEARRRRLEEQDALIGYCFENAEAASKVLSEKGISDELHKVGIFEDLANSFVGEGYRGRYDVVDDRFFEMLENANRSGEIPDWLPRSREDLPQKSVHYVVVADFDGDRYVVEPCSEIRDRFREAYVGRLENLVYQNYYFPDDSKLMGKQ